MKRNQTLITLIGMVALLSACGKQIHLSEQEKTQKNVDAVLQYAITQQQQGSSKSSRNALHTGCKDKACLDAAYTNFLNKVKGRFTKSALLVTTAGNNQAYLYRADASQPQLNTGWTMNSTVNSGAFNAPGVLGGAVALTVAGPYSVAAAGGAFVGYVQGGVIKNFAFVAAFGYINSSGAYVAGALSCTPSLCVTIPVTAGMLAAIN